MAAPRCELSTVKQHFPLKVCVNGPVRLCSSLPVSLSGADWGGRCDKQAFLKLLLDILGWFVIECWVVFVSSGCAG